MNGEERGKAAPRDSGARVPWQSAAAAVGVFLLLATLLLQRIGSADVCTGIEAVEALVVQRIASHDEWLFPRQNSGQPTFKPPLFHWSAVGLQRALGLGETTAGSVRLASAGWALATALATMWIARRALRTDAAFLFGVALLGMTTLVGEGRPG
ncbi:MAG: ArnT family glycosyltransferase, partial [Alphaproteobacteria bacterium]